MAKAGLECGLLRGNVIGIAAYLCLDVQYVTCQGHACGFSNPREGLNPGTMCRDGPTPEERCHIRTLASLGEQPLPDKVRVQDHCSLWSPQSIPRGLTQEPPG